MNSVGPLFGASWVGLERCHIEAVAELEASVSPEPWSAALFEGELEMHSSARNWIVAELPGAEASADESPADVIGFGGMMFVEAEGHLMNIAVDPGHQGRGLATQILYRLTVEAIDRGTTDLTLEVRSDNEAAGKLYRRFGYGPVGLRKRYYNDGADALIMWAHDVHGVDYAKRLASISEFLEEPAS